MEILAQNVAGRLRRMGNNVVAGLRTAGVRKYAFIHIPKNGGLSIRKVLGDRFYTRNVMGEVGTAVLYRQHLGDREWDRAYKFCFVRNPWDRAVSIWRFLCLGHAAARRRNFGMNSGGVYGYGRDLDFRECLEGFSEPNLWERWHMTTQASHVTDADGQLMVDFVGRCERLQEDFNKVCDQIGMQRVQLPHESRTEHEHYTRYYDPETIRLVEQRYAEDIERFGYRFGD